MLISAPLSAFSFNAFQLLAPLGAQRMFSRSRKVEKLVFTIRKRSAKTFRAKNPTLPHKFSIFWKKSHFFFAKIRVFSVEIHVFTSVSARKFLLPHFSCEHIYGYQYLFLFMHFFPFSTIQHQSVLNENFKSLGHDPGAQRALNSMNKVV